MKSINICMNFGFIDPEFIEKAAPAELSDNDETINGADNTNKTLKRNKKRRTRWVPIAACFIVLLSLVFVIKFHWLISPYKRIQLNEQRLCGECNVRELLTDDTKIINNSDVSFPNKLPIYKISQRRISRKECNQMLDQLGIDKNARVSIEENEIDVTVRYTNESTGEFKMTKEELKETACEIFDKIPFIKETFEYGGLSTTTSVSSDSLGTITYSKGVDFDRVIDGIRVMGGDNCYLKFDNMGLAKIDIKLYNYSRIGTMNMVSLESALSKLRDPDDFNINSDDYTSDLKNIDTLRVDEVQLYYCNQYKYYGCKILQPYYRFSGIATDIDGKQVRFNAYVIAIPDYYTYVSQDYDD